MKSQNWEQILERNLVEKCDLFWKKMLEHELEFRNINFKPILNLKVFNVDESNRIYFSFLVDSSYIVVAYDVTLGIFL